MAVPRERTPEEIRRELESEREQLAQAVDTLRGQVNEMTDVSSKLQKNLPAFAAGALGVGFVLAGGIGATMRLVVRRGREGDEKARFGRFSLVDRD
jgi:Protein of unknown function (DUF3618)